MKKPIERSSDNVVAFTPASDADLEASLWLGRQQEGLSEADQKRFTAWLAESPAHVHAWNAMQGTWDASAELTKEMFPPGATRPPQILRQRVERGGLVAACAAGLGLIFSALFLTPTFVETPFQAETQTFRTEIGTQHTVKLSDGTSLTLNTDTVASAQLSPAERRLDLSQGEIFLKVATDPDRPFLVQTPAGSIRVVGTAFSAYLKSQEKLEVTVEEGLVEVIPAPSDRDSKSRAARPAASDRLFSLKPGERAFLGVEGPELQTLSTSELKTALAWREGLVMFSGQPLGEVVEHVSRYTDIRISIADDQLAAIPIGGHFRVGEVDALLESLEMIFGISAAPLGPKAYALHRKRSAQ
ncbi:MAG: FecR domain-containing protein [Halieaceae bacterium]